MTIRRREIRNQKSEGRRHKSDLRPLTSDLATLTSDVPLLRVFFLAWLIMASLFLTAAFAVEGDIVFKRSGEGSTGPAVFPHWVHRIRYKCYACHPEPFQMKAGANKITMELIQQGKFCGVCHNNKIAWGMSFDTCNKCHVGK